MVGARMRRVLSAVLAVALVASGTVPIAGAAGTTTAGTGPAGSKYAKMRAGEPRSLHQPTKASGALNVRLRPGVPTSQLEAAGSRMGFTVSSTSSTLGWARLVPRKGVSAGALATRLREAGLVRTAAPAVTYQASAVTPNDPLFSTQWPLRNTGQTGGTADADIDAVEAWDRTRGDQDLVVAVVDTGVNWEHADLKPNAWRNVGEVPNNDVDDDDNGYVDDVRGYDFYNYDGSVYDVWDGDQHGTHVAGIIAAEADNGVGIAGVADVTIMPVKFLGPWGGDDYSGAEAIVYAVDNGADVINCSWGGEGESEILDEALAYANEAGVLVVCAAGNDWADIDATPYFPASSSSPNVIAVAATDHDDKLAWYSNYGAEKVEVAAPGDMVNSTLPWETSGVLINRPPYRICYQPVQLEVLEPASARDALIVKSVEQVGATTSSPVLIVDDSAAKVTGDTPGERLAIYVNALSSAGYTSVSTWDTDTKGSPTMAAMRGKVVVWFTGRNAWGYYDDPTLVESDIDVLTEYLDNGGRLVMASGELATDMLYFWIDPEWFYQYFGVDLFDILTWSDNVRGRANTKFAGINATIPEKYTTDDYFWPTGSDAIIVDPEDPSITPLTQVGGYGPLSGTSMAAPHVTGAAALLLAADPGLSLDELSSRLSNSGDGLEALEGRTAFESRLNANAASGTYGGRPKITAPTPGTPLHAGETQAVRWSPASGGTPTGFEAEWGLPVVSWTDGFEDGTSDDWVVELEEAETPVAPFVPTTDAAWVHSGAYGLRSGQPGPAQDLGDGWTGGGVSAAATTITVPPGGGTLSMWWKVDMGSNKDQDAIVWLGDTELAWRWMESTDGWERLEAEVPSGKHVLTAVYVNWEFEPVDPQYGMAIDDIALTTHDFTPLGSVDASSHEITFTVPAVDVDDAWIRVRSTGPNTPSSWAYVRDLRVSTDVDAPGAPTGLSVAATGDGFASAEWTNPADADFAGTKVMWRADRFPTGPSDTRATVAAEGTMTAGTVGPARHAKTAYVAAYSQDKAGNWSEAATATVSIVDTTAPEPVSFLEADYFDFSATVTWMAPDPASYDVITVLRRTDKAPTAGDPGAEVVFKGTGAMASDWDLDPEATDAYYTVYATDVSGNRSAVRSTHLSIDIEAPDGFMDLAGGSDFVPNRTIAVSNEVEGAVEMRHFLNGEVDDEAPWVPFSAESTMTLENLDGPQSVLGQFRDENGNVLELEDDVYLDLQAPEAPFEPFAENWNTGVRLWWSETDDASVIGYRVYKATSPVGPWTDVTPDDEMGAAVGFPSFIPVDTGGFFVGELTAGRTCYFAVEAVDAIGRVSPKSFPAMANPDFGVVRVAGSDRYSTAAQIVRRHFTRASTAVLVSGTAWADALGASALAGCYNGPVLLTGGTTLDPFAAAEIERLGVTKVKVVGGEKSIGKAVVAELTAKGITVERIAGADRYETASKVAERVTVRNEEWDGRVLCVSGASAADALAVGPYAYATKTPVLLVAANGVPAGTKRFLDRVTPPGDADWVVVGGPASVPERVIGSIASQWTRIGGANRYVVASNFARFAEREGALAWERAGVCNGMSTADALAAGPALGKAGGMLLLTTPLALNEATAADLERHSSTVGLVELYGGSRSVSTKVYQELHKAMSMPSGPLEAVYEFEEPE